MAKRSNEPQDIADVFNLSEIAEPILKPQDYMDTPMILHNFELQKGKQGDFYVLDVTIIETEERVKMSTGAWQPKKLLARVMPRHLPLKFQFTQIDTSYQMVSTKEHSDTD